MITDNIKDSSSLQEEAISRSLIMKVNGHNVTHTFSTERNDEVSNHVKKILLASYINKDSVM
ncbi:MAG: hypothetical protein CVU87_01205 [Firmicutes bacterium HGW-Firmicutes-12]|nr:MAG: hypothetical protein CVU87_01205 [Firmicutes bacterium HGW-Firmicutes-12]